jgi:3D-(3,5/4)-trihydroxycyclohexane-1,2-dione acylhydrolase (decyclizing)
MRSHPRTSVVVVEVDLNQRVPGYESWWDVPIAEVSEMRSVQAAHVAYLESKRKERYFF